MLKALNICTANANDREPLYPYIFPMSCNTFKQFSDSRRFVCRLTDLTSLAVSAFAASSSLFSRPDQVLFGHAICIFLKSLPVIFSISSFFLLFYRGGGGWMETWDHVVGSMRGGGGSSGGCMAADMRTRHAARTHLSLSLSLSSRSSIKFFERYKK
jgi:hypothetical protein